MQTYENSSIFRKGGRRSYSRPIKLEIDTYTCGFLFLFSGAD